MEPYYLLYIKNCLFLSIPQNSTKRYEKGFRDTYVTPVLTQIRLKIRFINLNFYSLPQSILFILRKRVNLIFFIITILTFSLYGAL